ncbi:hypothetical protein M1432_01240 [Patescibacteria group bacterium]|nr:hypothetical protein [Patescibacteria group bacterium]
MAKVLKRFKRLQTQYFFFALTIVLIVVVAITVVWAVVYLGESFDTALTVPHPNPPRIQFDIQGFQKLNLPQQ